MMPDTLHARLRAVYEERLALAYAASATSEGTTPTGEHWRWECGTCDTTVDIDPVVMLDEFLQCPRCETVGVDLRSVEQYQTQHVGELPHMITHGSEEMRPVDAAFIVANDPAAVIARCEALLRVVERHRPVKARGGPVGWESDRIACDACAPTRWPCPDVRDLAAGEGIEVEAEVAPPSS